RLPQTPRTITDQPQGAERRDDPGLTHQGGTQTRAPRGGRSGDRDRTRRSRGSGVALGGDRRPSLASTAIVHRARGGCPTLLTLPVRGHGRDGRDLRLAGLCPGVVGRLAGLIWTNGVSRFRPPPVTGRLTDKLGAVLTIDQATRDAIVAHARRDHPDEACG